MAEHWEGIQPLAEPEMVKNMADSCIVFHFYATSLPPPGKAEEGKQSRISSGAVSLRRHVSAARPAQHIKKYFTLLFAD